MSNGANMKYAILFEREIKQKRFLMTEYKTIRAGYTSFDDVLNESTRDGWSICRTQPIIIQDKDSVTSLFVLMLERFVQENGKEDEEDKIKKGF